VFIKCLAMMIAADPVEVDSYEADCDTVAPVSRGHAPFALSNRTANPVVRVILSSPLHPWLSRGLALITVTGSRNGRRYTFRSATARKGTG
jgi:hypothetical protein